MSIITEVYLAARGQQIVKSLEPAIEARNKAEKEIHDTVNEFGKLELIDQIAMMVPIVTASLKDAEYFGQIFGGAPGLSHAEAFKKMDLPEFADIQRIAHTVFGLNQKQKFLVSFMEDTNSPAGFSVKKLLLLIDSNTLKSEASEEVNRMLETVGIPEGYSVSVLFDTTLEYKPEQARFQQMLTSNLICTYLLSTLAVKNPTVFTGEFNYKISGTSGRSTYLPDTGEVLFELTQTDEAPASWFDIFDKVENEDFDLNTELTSHINANLAQLATAV